MKNTEFNRIKKEIKKIGKEIDKQEREIDNLKEKETIKKIKGKVEKFQESSYKNLKETKKRFDKIKKDFDKIKNRKITSQKKKITLGMFLFFGLCAITILGLIFWVLKNSIPSIMSIFIKFFGSYEFSNLFSFGFLFLFMGIALIELIITANIIEAKKNKFPWLFATIVLMFCFFIISLIYTQMTIGQGDLNLILRNSNNLGEIIGNVSCKGSSNSFLLVNEPIYCKVYPELEKRTIEVQFIYENKTKSEKILLTNDTFISQDSVKYLAFEVEGNNNAKHFLAEVGYPYHFLTEEEVYSKKQEFLKYLGGIFVIIFISIPLLMKQLKDLSKE